MGRFIGKPERSLRELYGDDPERADALAWGRRGALGGAALAAVGAALGAAVPFGRRLPTGMLPAALAQAPAEGGGGGPAVLRVEGKAPLVLLGERPMVAETPETMLDDEVTPAAKMYVRNNGGVPEAPADPRAWKLRIEGEVERPLEIAVGGVGGRALPARHAPPATGVRRQRALLLRARGARQPVGQWRRLLRRMDGRAPVRPAARRRAEGGREVHRAFRRRPAPLRRPEPAGDQPRHADREGDGGEHARRLPPQRRADPHRCTARRSGWWCRAGRARSARSG